MAYGLLETIILCILAVIFPPLAGLAFRSAAALSQKPCHVACDRDRYRYISAFRAHVSLQFYWRLAVAANFSYPSF